MRIGKPSVVHAAIGIAVPDQRNDPRGANFVIDPTGAQDSTAGLQNFLDSTPNGSTITLPFSLTINGQILLQGNRTFQGSGNVALNRTVDYAWRPSGGLHSQFQYDTMGGQANKPVSLNNPYWYPLGQYVDSHGTTITLPARQVTGCSVSAGGTTVTAPAGSFKPGGIPGDVGALLTTVASLNGSASGQFTPTAPNYARTNINSVAADGSSCTINNPANVAGTNITVWVMPGDSASGAINGGYSGTTGKAGMDYDGLHLTDRWSAPFNSSHLNQVIQIVVNANLGQLYNHIISGVSADGKTVTFSNADNSSQHNDTGGTCAWAITTKGKTWTAIFQPNPLWNPTAYNGGTNKPWNGYIDCLNGVGNLNVAATVKVADTSVLKGIEIVGANRDWRVAIVSYDKAAPVINEFQHCVSTTASTAQVVNCNLHNPWGDCENGPGQMRGNYMGSTGRQGCTGHFTDKVIDNNTIELTHHSVIDFEIQGVSNVHITNNCFGGPHGMAYSSNVDGLTFQGNHSVAADVSSGRIGSLAPYSRIKDWGGGGSSILIDSNHFDMAAGDDPNLPAYTLSGTINGLTVTNNSTPTNTCFLSVSPPSQRNVAACTVSSNALRTVTSTATVVFAQKDVGAELSTTGGNFAAHTHIVTVSANGKTVTIDKNATAGTNMTVVVHSGVVDAVNNNNGGNGIANTTQLC